MTRTEASGSTGPEGLLLRPAEPEDGPEIAALYTAARSAAVPFMPPSVHSPQEDLAHFVGILTDDRHEVWVAEVAGEVAGFVSLTPTWVDDLFVHPRHQRRGVATALVDLVKALRPGGFGLYVFESNTPARGLYRRAGLVETERSDGSANAERQPDIRMEWSGDVGGP